MQCLGEAQTSDPSIPIQALMSQCAPHFKFLYIDQERLLLYPLFSLEKKGILISCQSRSVVRPSVRPSVCLSLCPCVRPSVTFLVNVSPPKPLEVATSNFVGE